MKIAELIQPQVRQWIQEHEYDEPAQLMLQAHRFPDIPVREAVAQIQARQKAKQKLPAWHGRENIIYPPSLSVEQASSEETAMYKAALLKGKSLADLTGGMGVDTYYLSQHFEKVWYVEQQAALCELAQHNFQTLGATHIAVINSPAEYFIKKLPSLKKPESSLEDDGPRELDAIYLDPARRGEGNQKLYKLSDCQPNVVELLPKLLQITNTVLLKAAPMLDIQQALQELHEVQEVHVLAVKNEVKELLFLIRKGHTAETHIKTVNLGTENRQLFDFYLQEEQQTSPVISEPLNYLYEPNAAILKAGAFKLLAQRFQLNKLHPNSHLYTSQELIKDFPGRAFKIIHTGKPDKKNIRRMFPEGKALISSRNHPMSVKQLSQKTGLPEGGSRYLFATTFSSGKPDMLVCERIY